LIPDANRPKQAIPGMEIIPVKRVEEAVARIRELG
jgi:DNA repair protein RadA/Sms